MALIPFYSQRNPRRFEHKPIYYDPHKEEMEARKLRIKRELGMEAPPEKEEYGSRIRGSFVEGTKHLKRSYDRGEDGASRVKKSGWMLLLALLLVIILWFLFRG
ncbi:hypothetical protein FACS189411_17350 [Bacteroidia bacterium]|nr:hypothetical protein FACS189411_17350 [Bacteroidia bacterium]